MIPIISKAIPSHPSSCRPTVANPDRETAGRVPQAVRAHLARAAVASLLLLLGVSAGPARAASGSTAPSDSSSAAAASSDAGPADAAPNNTSSSEPTAEVTTITVTARKRGESLAEVPTSITAFTGEALQDFNIQSFNDYATMTPNLSFSYGGGPTGIADARAVAIRGITGQNLFGTAGATGFYIDDTPLPGSVDPRVLDIDNIEVLKGPQGTLYGESSLGGNIRLVTKQPSLTTNSFSYSADAGVTSGAGSPDGGVNAVGNLVVIPDTFAVHLVAFGDHEGGYLTRTYPTAADSPATTDPFLSVPRTSVGDQGAITTYGGSLSALLRIADDFDIKVRVMHQEQKDYGFPATFAPLPEYTPVYTLNRAFDVQPIATDNWTLPSLDLTFRGKGFTVTSSTSYFHRHTEDLEDSTYGTQQIFASYYEVSGLPAQPYLWQGDHTHNEISSETRISFDPVGGFSGTAGYFFSNTNTLFYIPPTYAQGLVAATANNTVVGPWPNNEIWTQSNPGNQKDNSIFGELYYKFLDQFTLTLGLREYWLKQHTDYIANGFMNFGPTPSDPQSNSENGTNPKVGLAYQVNTATMVYASASKGFRAGGAQAFLPFCAEPALPVSDITQLKSDTLWTYEAGTKIQFQDPDILLSAAAFHIDWKNIQQQVALPCGSYFDINGNKARINGGEFEVLGHVTHDFQVRAGFGYESTSITDPGALGLVGLTAGTRILDTPAVTGSLGGVYKHPLFGETSGFISADYSYTGDSISLLNSGYGATATRPSYSIVNTRFGLDWGNSELAFNVRNLTNAKPNLGDIGYVGYAQNTAAGTVIPQVATLPPVTFTLEFKQSF
jgi:iron complex outermembrane recepter protein